MDHERRWFYFLKSEDDTTKGKALMDRYSNLELAESMIVSRETYNGGREFTLFRSHIELYRFIRDIPDHERVFHEVCIGSKLQKPRFDIDICAQSLLNKSSSIPNQAVKVDSSLDDVKGVDIVKLGEEVLEALITSILLTLSKSNVNLDIAKNVIVFSSHGPSKRSYHVIIHGYMHNSSNEARGFYQEVMKNMEGREKYEDFVDHGIYSKNHALRMVWSHKDGRIKKMESSLTHKGKKYTVDLTMKEDTTEYLILAILTASLVTWTSGCEMLPPYRIPEKAAYNSAPIADEHVQLALDKMKDELMEPDGTIPFDFAYSRGSIIGLTRRQPSMCKVCNKAEPHTSDHAYMMIVGSEVRFFCWRTKKIDGKREYRVLGTIPNRTCVNDRVMDAIFARTKKMREERGDTTEAITSIVHATDRDIVYPKLPPKISEREKRLMEVKERAKVIHHTDNVEVIERSDGKYDIIICETGSMFGRSAGVMSYDTPLPAGSPPRLPLATSSSTPPTSSIPPTSKSSESTSSLYGYIPQESSIIQPPIFTVPLRPEQLTMYEPCMENTPMGYGIPSGPVVYTPDSQMYEPLNYERHQNVCFIPQAPTVAESYDMIEEMRRMTMTSAKRQPVGANTITSKTMQVDTSSGPKRGRGARKPSTSKPKKALYKKVY